MNIRNCRKCGKLFNYMSGPRTCQACREEMEIKFQEVKEYIRSNKRVGIHELSEACEVEVSQIRQWLREERLELTPDSPIAISCESCGDQIRSGKFCEKCKQDMAKGFTKATQKEKTEEEPTKPRRTEDPRNSRMRFLDWR